ncbi:MAG: fibronectin type III domain-containing protein [Methanomassiliicoccales archaeon]|nr:fibronectin type III domain-containing protein [Methanomassiliicoccales archaeon]
MSALGHPWTMMRFPAAALIMALCLVLVAPVVIGEELPGAPMNFTAERDGARIFLSWERPLDNVTVLHYSVYRGTDPGGLTFYDDVDANFTGGYDTEVIRGQTYYYAISANGTDGEGPLSPTVQVLPPSDDLSIMVMPIILSVVIVTLLFAYWKGRSRE